MSSDCTEYCGTTQSWQAELLTAGIVKIQVFCDVMLSPVVNIHLKTVKYGIISQNTWMHKQAWITGMYKYASSHSKIYHKWRTFK